MLSLHHYTSKQLLSKNKTLQNEEDFHAIYYGIIRSIDSI